MLIVSGDKILWVDFDVVSTFSNVGPREEAYCKYEAEHVKSFGNILVCLAFLLRISCTVPETGSHT
jgi:hypothetical protein